MIRQTHTIPPQCMIGEALRQMADLRLQDFPVVDEKKMLLGTLNFWQILEWAMPPYISQGDLPDVRFAPNLVWFHERLGELNPKTVYLLPVVEGDHQLVGIISAWDVIKEIAG